MVTVSSSVMKDDEKRSASIGGLRITECAAQEYKKALKYYGVRRADFARMCIDRLIEHYQRGDPLALPIEFRIRNQRNGRR
jgi:hypothetical protein